MTKLTLNTHIFNFKLKVTRSNHFYSRNIEEKEEGGTPAIVESIRAGLAFKLKQVMELNHNYCAHFINVFNSTNGTGLEE